MSTFTVLSGRGDNAILNADPSIFITNYLDELSIEMSVTVITANYTILDTDGVRQLNVDSTNGNIIVTLPIVANNINRRLFIFVSVQGGKVSVDGNGVETINGIVSIALQNQYDYIELIGTVTGWIVTDSRITYDTGWLTNSDWTNRHLGSVTMTYVNLVGVFIFGETITDLVTGATGIIQSDAAGVLILKNVAGIFGAGNGLQGNSSGTTADVNAVPKNVDSSIFHEFDYNISSISTQLVISSDGTENNSLVHGVASTIGAFYGWTIYQIDSNNFKIQTGAGGIYFNEDTVGGNLLLAAQDWFYKIRIIMEI